MENLGTLLTLGLTILAIATAAGFGLQRGRIATLRAQLDDSDKEAARKDRRLEDAETQLEDHKTSSDAEIGRLKTDLAALARIVTGEAHWVAISDKLDLHHDEAEAHWLRDEHLLEEIRDRLPTPGETDPKASSS